MERTSSDREKEKASSSERQRDGKDSDSSRSGDDSVASLQQTIGNQAVQRLYERGEIQANLTVNQPGDPAEREAERVAEQVMQLSGRELDSQSSRGALIDRKATAGRTVLDKETEEQVESVNGDGRPLSSSTRSFFEPRFGRDFSDVRVHTGPKADAAARSINAKAFTMGTDIAFAKHNYRPNSKQGKALLAHELTHVVQQNGAKTDRPNAIQRKNGGKTSGGKSKQQSGSGKGTSKPQSGGWDKDTKKELLKKMGNAWQMFLDSLKGALNAVSSTLGIKQGGGGKVPIYIDAVLGALSLVGGTTATVAGAIGVLKTLFKAGSGGKTSDASSYLNGIRSNINKIYPDMKRSPETILDNPDELKGDEAKSIFEPILNETKNPSKVRKDIKQIRQYASKDKLFKELRKAIIKGFIRSPDEEKGYIYYELWAPDRAGRFEFEDQPYIPELSLGSQVKDALVDNWGANTPVSELGLPITAYLYHKVGWPHQAQVRAAGSRPERRPNTYTKFEMSSSGQWTVSEVGDATKAYSNSREIAERALNGFLRKESSVVTVSDLDLAGW